MEVLSSNRTFMELKYVEYVWLLVEPLRSNRTFMELKFETVAYGVQAYKF